MSSIKLSPIGWVILGVFAVTLVKLAYLNHINNILKGVPREVQQLSGPRWTEENLRKSYEELEKHPIDYTDKIPPKLDRRYVVTGGNGLVGGYIVLQLLARGTSPLNIRILDIRKPERRDMMTEQVSRIQYIHTDIRSENAVAAAFDMPWDLSVANMPMTVFHTAAVILASERSKYVYDLPEAINVVGTKNVVAAAKVAGADIFSSTSSGSISVEPVNPWVEPWAKEPRNFYQVLDERDFNRPLRPHEDFFGNYPATKAAAERVVCAANCEGFRTGCIRPANGVYGNPTDNTIGATMSKAVYPTWVPHIVQNFVHGANVAIAHLHQEAALLSDTTTSHAGRPYVVTDPNPPITYGDTYKAVATLSHHPFRTVLVAPIVILVLSYIVEFYNLLPYRIPSLRRFLPEIKGETSYLQPALFSICTHLIASDAEARKGVEEGGLGYEGVLTTMEGVALEILEWNREHETEGEGSEVGVGGKKVYTSSNAWADQLRAGIAQKIGGR